MNDQPTPERPGDSAVVSFSGGQDSTTCLYWALARFKRVEALSFDYGQRHRIELESARRIAALAGVPHTVLPVSSLGALGGSSLTDADEDVTQELGRGALPKTFVPGRNIVFLTLAATFAWQRGIRYLVAGVCQTDYSGYPDCRRETMDSLERTIALGLEHPVAIHTPLMWLTKAESVTLAAGHEGCLDALALSHTCYSGAFPPCLECAACELREKGFQEAGVRDPLRLRAESTSDAG